MKEKNIYNLEKQHKKGKLHAIERINRILDNETFCELWSKVGPYGQKYDTENLYDYDGVITGYGYIHDKLV